MCIVRCISGKPDHAISCQSLITPKTFTLHRHIISNPWTYSLLTYFGSQRTFTFFILCLSWLFFFYQFFFLFIFPPYKHLMYKVDSTLSVYNLSFWNDVTGYILWTWILIQHTKSCTIPFFWIQTFCSGNYCEILSYTRSVYSNFSIDVNKKC